VSGVITCEAGSQALTSGTATCKVTYANTNNSPHHITATYNGDLTFNASSPSNQIDQTVSQTATSTTLLSSLNPSAPTDPVTFTATVSPTAATGTVAFKDNNASIIAACDAATVS